MPPLWLPRTPIYRSLRSDHTSEHHCLDPVSLSLHSSIPGFNRDVGLIGWDWSNAETARLNSDNYVNNANAKSSAAKLEAWNDALLCSLLHLRAEEIKKPQIDKCPCIGMMLDVFPVQISLRQSEASGSSQVTSRLSSRSMA